MAQRDEPMELLSTLINEHGSSEVRGKIVPYILGLEHQLRVCKNLIVNPGRFDDEDKESIVRTIDETVGKNFISANESQAQSTVDDNPEPKSVVSQSLDDLTPEAKDKIEELYGNKK